MANLINSSADLKANFGSLSLNFTWANIASFVADVERDIIADTIGDAQLAYFAGNLTGLSGVPLQVLTLLQRAESYLSILNWSQTALFQFEDKALYLAKTTIGAIPSDKKLRDLRDHCEEKGFNFLDSAISLMENNLVSFGPYAASANRQQASQGFIRTAIEFNRQRSISNSRLTFLSLVTVMLEIQDTRLPDIMTPEYYALFQTRYLSDALSPAEKALLPLVQKAMAMLTIAQACLQLPLKISSKGILVNKYQGRTDYDQQDPADLAQAQFLQDDHLDKGERALSKLKKYLETNAGNIPDYRAPLIDNTCVNSKHNAFFNLM